MEATPGPWTAHPCGSRNRTHASVKLIFAAMWTALALSALFAAVFAWAAVEQGRPGLWFGVALFGILGWVIARIMELFEEI